MMQIEADGFDALEVSGEGHLRRVIEFMSAKDGPRFVILSTSAEEYIQAAFDGDDYLVMECRKGTGAAHFKAVRAADDEDELFNKDEVGEVLVAYWRGEPSPAWMSWQKAAV